MTADAGGRTDMRFVWSDEAFALVNASEKIAIQRVDLVSDTSAAPGVHNIAFAWEDGKTIEQMERVMWVHNLPDGRAVDAWVSLDQSRKWNITTRSWDAL